METGTCLSDGGQGEESRLRKYCGDIKLIHLTHSSTSEKMENLPQTQAFYRAQVGNKELVDWK